MEEPNGEGREPLYWSRATWFHRTYVVQDGLIRPVPWSHLKPYDPFTGEGHSEKLPPDRPIYEQLYRLSLSNERAIADFVSTWGILGLFQDRLIQARRVLSATVTLIESPDGWP